MKEKEVETEKQEEALAEGIPKNGLFFLLWVLTDKQTKNTRFTVPAFPDNISNTFTVYTLQYSQKVLFITFSSSFF